MKKIFLIISSMFFIGCNIEEKTINEAKKQIELKIKEQGINIETKKLSDITLKQAISTYNNQQIQTINNTNQIGMAYMEAIRKQSILTLKEMKNSVPSSPPK